MKKLVTIALLCAMLLSCFAGCAMQKGEIAVADAAVVENVAFDESQAGISAELRANIEEFTAGTLSGNEISEWDGTSVNTEWFTGDKGEYILNSAAELAGMLFLQSQGTTFEGVEITLGKHIDLKNHAWAGATYSATSIFKGTFDGNNKVIGNYKMAIDKTADNAFFGSVGAGGTLKNVALVNGDYKNNNTGGTLYRFGIAVSRVETLKNADGSTDNEVTISNIYTDCDLTLGSATKKIRQSGMIGAIMGDGNITIDKCENAGDISVNGYLAGGIIGEVDAANIVTVTNCVNSGTIDATGGGYTSGIVGSVGYVASGGTSYEIGGIVISNCYNYGHIKNASSYTAGILSFVGDMTGELEITNCKNTGKIESTKDGANASGGILGTVETAKKVSVIGCDVDATVIGTNMCGGVVGYLNGVDVVIIEDCSFDGTVNFGRASGGILGFSQPSTSHTTQSVSIKNCVVEKDAYLKFNVAGKAPSVGGIAGRVRATTFEMEGCQFNGTLEADFNTDAAGLKKAAGGLVGVLFDESDNQVANACATITNCQVNGTLNYSKKKDNPSFAVYVGANLKGTVTYNGLSTGENLVVEAGTEPVAMNGTSATVVGYQTTDVAGGKYDLRYVATVDNPVEGTALGFVVSIYTKNGDEKVAKLEDKVVYAEYIYTKISGGNETYNASDFYADYLYTLVIKGIDENYTVANGNLEIVITPFVATQAEVEGEMVVTATNAYTAQHGEIVINVAE